MSDLTLRDRAAELLHQANEASEALTDESGEADYAKVQKLFEASSAATNALVAANAANNSNDQSAKFLRERGLDSSGAEQAAEEDRLSRESGIAKPKYGQTLGEVFAASEAYTDLIAQTGGNITKNTPVKTDTVEVASYRRGAARSDLIVKQDGKDGGFAPDPVTLPMQDEAALPDQSWLRDLCTKVAANGSGYKYTRLISRTNGAGMVKEAVDTGILASDGTGGTVSDVDGGLKPMSDFEWSNASGSLEMVANWMPITRQAAAYAPQLVTFINTFLPQGLDAAENAQFILGDGSSPNLKGLLNTVDPYTNINVVSTGADNRFDVLLAAQQVVRQAMDGRMFNPTGIVINTTDFYSTEFLGARDGQGNYLFGGPGDGAPAQNGIWGQRVVTTNDIAAGTQLMGDFRYALVFSNGGTKMYMTDSHRDWFARNILAILAEREVGFAVMADQAFVLVTP